MAMRVNDFWCTRLSEKVRQLLKISLVSTHVVCERLFAMQGLPDSRVWHGKIYAHFAKNTNCHFEYPRIPPPPPEN